MVEVTVSENVVDVVELGVLVEVVDDAEDPFEEVPEGTLVGEEQQPGTFKGLMAGASRYRSIPNVLFMKSCTKLAKRIAPSLAM